jgi:DNA polymerase bacteriophage-type
LGHLLTTLSIDFETRSTVDLKTQGAYRYAEDPTTDVWCMAWAFDDEEPVIWTPDAKVGHLCERYEPSAPLPCRVVEHILSGGEIRAWNAQFERLIWREIMVKRYNCPPVAPEQWVCSAAEAAAMALPRSLDQCALVCKVGLTKDLEGYEQMLRMSRPRKINDDGTIVWWDVEERKQRLYSYCKQDVRVERALVKALRRLTPREREMYLLDQRMNDHGVGIDVDLVRAAQRVAGEGTNRADAELAALTGGAVDAVSNHKMLLGWVKLQGVDATSVAKPAVAELLEGELPPAVRRALEIRSDAGRSSVAKLQSMLDVVCADGRAHGLLLYHGANTGRWSGKLIQPHNFPRGEVKDVEWYIEYVMKLQYDFIDLFEHPIVVISSMLRSMITAAPGKVLIAADFSAIEARVLNWLADERQVLEAFHAMDSGDKNKHPYKNMAVAMGRAARPEDVIKGSTEYQAGKAAELGCGYQMGWKKFISAAWDVYQLEVNENEAKTAVEAYRESHPNVVDFWWETQNAAIEAVLNPGRAVAFGGRKNLKAVKAGAYLYLILPSGRPLCYAAPSVVEEPPPWGGEPRPSLHYWGVHQKTGQWVEMRTYGGHLVENIVQAVARDLMAEAKLRGEARGYPPILSVHDEVVAEVPEGFGSVKEFEDILAELPAWADGCPVAAEGWMGFRYRK